MSGLSWKWLAGFVDADGSFTIGIRSRGRVDGSINLTFHPVINIRQKDSVGGIDIINRIAEWLGAGRVYVGERNDGTSSVTWQTTNIAEVLEIGSSIYNELQLKRGPAEKVIRCAFLIAESVNGYNHNADMLWELYTLYRDINPDGNWSDRKRIITREEIEEIAAVNGKRRGSKSRIAYNAFSSLPSDVLERVTKD